MGDRVAAEDVAQEAFIKLLSNPPREERNLAGWLHLVATRLAYNHLRGERRRREREHRTALHGDGAIDDPTAVGEVIAGAVHDALRRLPERDRLALIMRFHGYRYAEIATALGVEPASMGTILARAQARFRREYEGEGTDR